MKNKTKNIQDVVAEKVKDFGETFTYREGHELHEIALYPYPMPTVQAWLTQTLTQLVKEVEAGERTRIEKLNKEIGNLRDTPRVRRDFCEWCGAVCLKGDVCDCHTEKVRQDLLDIVTDDIKNILTPPTSDVIEK